MSRTHETKRSRDRAVALGHTETMATSPSAPQCSSLEGLRLTHRALASFSTTASQMGFRCGLSAPLSGGPDLPFHPTPHAHTQSLGLQEARGAQAFSSSPPQRPWLPQ